MTDMSQTGIRITAKFFPLMWILYFIKPFIGLDGSEVKGAWRTPTFIPTAPGEHTASAYFPYVLLKKAGKGTRTVTVAPGQVVELTYKAPWFIFLKGSMKDG
jgi:hypothetical protein